MFYDAITCKIHPNSNFRQPPFCQMIIYQSHDYTYEIIGSLTPETMGIDTGIVLKSTLEPGISVK